MAQNITLLGANYQAVPAVELPKTGGGTASFTDVTDTTATAADVAAGTYFYTANGVRTAGTGSGGGGLPDYSQASNGDVLAIVSGSPAWVNMALTTQQIEDAVDAAFPVLNYTVTVSLTNPIASQYFRGCNIYKMENEVMTEEDITSSANLLAEITSASGSASFELSQDYYGIAIEPQGAWGASYSESNVTTSSSISYVGRGSINYEMSKYSVAGDGTITIDGIDYDD